MKRNLSDIGNDISNMIQLMSIPAYIREHMVELDNYRARFAMLGLTDEQIEHLITAAHKAAEKRLVENHTAQLNYLARMWSMINHGDEYAQIKAWIDAA